MAESKSPSAASVGWFDLESWDVVADDVPAHECGGNTDVGAFDTECPCCGQIISFRLFCNAVAHETESDR